MVTGEGAVYAAAFVAFGAALALAPLVIRLARRCGWVARPRADRWHARPTALMGGIAIYAAATFAFVLFGGAGAPWIVWGGATLMFALGLADDLRGVSPTTKLVTQVAATVLLLYAGYVFGAGGPYWLAAPLTFIWVIGITNAVNLLDNMDGLAAGIAGLAALALAGFAAWTAGDGATVAALAVAGAAAGFLIYNFEPARIFMGDCGSLFLGYVIAALALIVQGSISGPGGLAVYLATAAVLAVPIFDTTLVTVARLLAGRPVSEGGRDHSSHRLVRLGFSERRAVLTLYGISCAFGVLALAFHVAAVPLFFAVTVFFVVGLAVFGVYLGRAEDVSGAAATQMPPARPPATAAQRIVALGRAVMGSHWKEVMALVSDLLVVAAAFILAHYLRFEGGLPAQYEVLLVDVLPAVIGLKLLVFAGLGLYRGLWRHAGTPEAVRILVATALGSVLAYAASALFYGPSVLSEAAFVIDWMIVTGVVAGTRFGFRALRQYFAAQRADGRRVLLYGADDGGLLALRLLRGRADFERTPVGFLDDDARKHGRTTQGLPVLGALDDLPSVAGAHAVDEVLVTASRLTEARRAEIARCCRRTGISCQLFDVALRPIGSDVAPSHTVVLNAAEGDGANRVIR